MHEDGDRPSASLETISPFNLELSYCILVFPALKLSVCSS